MDCYNDSLKQLYMDLTNNPFLVKCIKIIPTVDIDKLIFKFNIYHIVSKNIKFKYICVNLLLQIKNHTNSSRIPT